MARTAQRGYDAGSHEQRPPKNGRLKKIKKNRLRGFARKATGGWGKTGQPLHHKSTTQTSGQQSSLPWTGRGGKKKTNTLIHIWVVTGTGSRGGQHGTPADSLFKKDEKAHTGGKSGGKTAGRAGNRRNGQGRDQCGVQAL